MKVGEYVRTYNNGIGKILEIDKLNDFVKIGKEIGKEKWILPRDIIRKSNILIGLIEVGDYVNGHKVLDIAEAPKRVLYLNDISQKGALIPRENIKSIVTKEQFESMEYKVKG